MFDTQREFLKEFFKKVDFEKKNQQTTKKDENCPGGGGGGWGKELIMKLHHWILRSSYSMEQRVQYSACANYKVCAY